MLPGFAFTNIPDQKVFASQAEFLRNAASRAVDDLEGLPGNARKTNPKSIPQIRKVLAQLEAAQAQANAFSAVATRGDLGPTYKATIQAALTHLDAASRL